MFRAIKSEMIKHKNSSIIWITLFFGFISFVSKILVLMSETSIDRESKIKIQISLMFIMMLVNTVIIVNRAYISEEEANKFQNILTLKNRWKQWASKLIVLAFMEIIIYGLAQFAGEIYHSNFHSMRLIMIVITIQAFVSILIHMIAQLVFNNIFNIVMGIAEIILLIFATNIPMKNWYLFPSCYGYKIYENINTVSILQWFIVIAVIAISLSLNLMFITRRKILEK